MEMAKAALAQKFLQEAPWDMVAKVLKEMDEGIPLSEAVQRVMDESEAAPETPTGSEMSSQPGPQESPMAEQLAMQKGRTQVEFPKNPLTNILVGTPRG
jgi:hypothetical protein